MFLVLSQIAREHKDVIQLKYDCDVKVGPEHSIDIGLNSGGGVCQPKWHHQVFKWSVLCSKSGVRTTMKIDGSKGVE